jgi:hypothetical protein
MLRRMWLTLSISWAVLICVFVHWGETRNGGAAWALGFAAAPLVIGWLRARMARYVVTGSRLRASRSAGSGPTFTPRPASRPNRYKR